VVSDNKTGNPSPELEVLRQAIEKKWLGELHQPGVKTRQYIDKFFNCKRIAGKISASVEGNHGNYTVNVELKGNDRLTSACSCYIGKSGGCHHCLALALTFLKNPESFEAVELVGLEKVRKPEDLEVFLKSVSLEKLLENLKAIGISQKQMAETVGMSPRQLTLIKTSESRNRFYTELGAVKLACL
jgi:uncharacterized Zn finger protein